MKNKLYYVLLSLIVSFSFINTVFAAGDLDFTVSAVADKTTLVKGTEATITVSIKSDSYINACTFEVEADSTLESKSIKGQNSFGEIVGNGIINVENSSISGNAPTSGIEILTLKYKVNGDGKVTIKTNQCVAPASEEVGSYSDIVINFTAKEDTSLSSLTVTGGKLSPAFSPDKLTYVLELSSPNFSLSMTASDSQYQDNIIVTNINGDTLDPSNITFDNGGQSVMPINITVNGVTTYSIGASYEQPELDNTLSSLKIDGKSVTLEDGVYEYVVKISKNTTEFDLEAVLSDSENFQFASTGNKPGNFSVSGDSTYVVLIVEPKSSQAGASSVTYNIEVVREGGSSTSGDSGNSSGDGTGNGSPGGQTSGNQSTGNNVSSNPSTGNISMFIMAFILIASLVGSVILYQKNLESYK